MRQPRHCRLAACRIHFGAIRFYSLGHGGNDAQKTMGIIPVPAVLAGLNHLSDRDDAGNAGWRLAHREDNGSKITRTPMQGFCAEPEARRRSSSPPGLAFSYRPRALHWVDHWGGPARRISSVRWIANNIVVAWIIAIQRRPRSPRHVTDSQGWLMAATRCREESASPLNAERSSA